MSTDRARKIRDLRILHIFNDGYLGAILLLLPFIASDFHLSFTQVGLLGSIVSISSIALALPAGYIASRIGGIRSLILAILLYSVGYIGIGILPSYALLILMYLIAGIGFGIFHPISFSRIAKWADVNVRGRELGAFSAVGDIGKSGFTVLISVIIGAIGWRLTSISYGFVAFILCVYFFTKYFLYNSPSKDGVTQPESKLISNTSSFFQLFRNKRLVFATLASMLDQFASQPLVLFLPFLLLKRGVPKAYLGFFVVAFFIGNLVGKVVAGRISDKYKSTTILIAAELVMAGLIISLALSYNIASIVVIAVLLGIVTKGTVPVTLIMISKSVPNHTWYNKAYAINALISGIGFTAAPIILGRVSDLFGIESAFYVCAAVATAVTIPALAYRYSKRDIS